MAKLAFPTTPLFWTAPESLISARLRETVALIAEMTVEDAALYPERSDHDWPNFDRMGLDVAAKEAARSAWWRIVAIVEQRVQKIDPESGGYDEAFCWPIYRVYGGHWLAVIEAAGLHVIEPLLPAAERARFQPQLGLRSGRRPTP